MNKEKKIGFTIGKFAPLHKGHEYLINKGLTEMDDFYIVIYDTPSLNINIEAKIKWIKSKFPTAKILTAYDSPKQYGLDKESVDIQMKYLVNIIKDIDVNYFYSSEEYGKCVADYLDINHVLVDEERQKYNISATKIRNNIDLYKNYLDIDVYNDAKKLL